MADRIRHPAGTSGYGRKVKAGGTGKRGTGRVSVRSDYYDYNLLAAVILLTCFGLVMLYSTSAYEASVVYQDDAFFFAKQAVIGVVSMILMVVLSQMDYHFFARFAFPLYIVSVLLLVATKFVGREINGATRWIYIGGISFQPAEMAKLAVILFLPVEIVKRGGQLSKWRDTLIVLVWGGIASFCTFFFTDNLSTALIIAGITVLLIFIVHRKLRPFIIGACIILLLGSVIVVYATHNADSSSFRLRRIAVWRDPEGFAKEGGYQVLQGLYAIGSGGWFGKGLGNSTQKLGALPEAQNDMIFSIICEELGVFGAALVILLFLFLLYRLFFIATNAPDLLGSLIASGIFIHIALQVILNIAVVSNMIPTTGVTLPFVSYGGTSILFLMMEMMLALSISRQIRLK